MVLPTAVLLLLRIFVGILVFVCLYMKLKFALSWSVKNCVGREDLYNLLKMGAEEEGSVQQVLCCRAGHGSGG